MADQDEAKVSANEAAEAASAEKAIAQTYEAKTTGKPEAPKPTATAKTVAAKPKPKPVAAKDKPVPAKKLAKKSPTQKAKAKAPKFTKPDTKFKETPIMDTTTTTTKKTFTDTAKDVAGTVQSKMKGAYEKGTEMTGEMVAFQKANAEAMIESGKIYYAGLKDMGQMVAEDGKKATEQMIEDAKDMAKVTSPTELVQLQGDIARRNFDAAIAFGSKATESWMKLANDTFAPISSRMSVAADKVAAA
ncbi:phasin family protein [Erythrobacter sp. 3-20A1M]|uniref:phasin family protein n=1 Tax=Erythrobacter sp. 3-20A1M TaxID=2653850 RepID=UPI001BFC3574|nr:phasin family protein [Erythrobacter sp. 3-20A1M]QWC57129.1 phasin family protein [Erythrobacter sp. 3-20A1M]